MQDRSGVDGSNALASLGPAPLSVPNSRIFRPLAIDESLAMVSYRATVRRKIGFDLHHRLAIHLHREVIGLWVTDPGCALGRALLWLSFPSQLAIMLKVFV